MKRIFAFGLLTLLLAAPVWALNDGVNFNFVPERANSFATAADVNTLAARVARTESTVTAMEQTLSEKIDRLQAELRDLRARLEARNRG